MKRILSLVILSFFFVSYLQVSGQVSANNWKAHFAYLNFVDIAVSEENVYVAATNSIFVHNIAANSNTVYTTVEGLSGEDISALYYSELQSLIVIGYENGLIELIDEISGKVTSLVDINNQGAFPAANLKINNFFQDENVLYIATGFGIVQYNLETGFFGDTFLISDSSAVVSDILAVGVFGDTILASIAGRGVHSGDKTSLNLISESSWSNIQSDVFVDIQMLDGKLVAHKNTFDVYNYNDSIFSSVYTSDSIIIDFQSNSNDELTLTNATGSIVLDTNFTELNNLQHGNVTDLNSQVSYSVYIGNELYFSNIGTGFYKTNNSSVEDRVRVNPDGPLENDAFSLDAYDGDLWICYGDTGKFFEATDNKKGLSRLRANEWLNIPFSDLNATTITGITINKEDKNNVLFSSYFEGLLEYNDEQFNLFTSFNSNLEFDVAESLSEDVVRVFKSIYDNQGNVWVLNNRTANGVKMFSSSGEGLSIDLTSIIPVPNENNLNLNFWDFEINDNQNIFVCSYNNGLIAYNSETTELVNLVGEEEFNMPSTTIRTVALDLNGELWLGTNDGIRKYSNPDNIFIDSNSQIAESIIFLEDGIAQELLFGQLITDIEVDESNNKWIGTSDGGVFYVSPDGQETIYNFTAQNSPLPSNEILDIGIDDSTGAVFFATSKGLMEFNSNITSAEEDLTSVKVFPNPVRPNYEDPIVTIQGLTTGANVKITDIEGNLVYETQNETFESGGSGSVLWDTKSFSGNKVATGVYLILITDAEGIETSIEKLLIVR